MIPVINDIDRLLQAAESRYGEAYARNLQLSASARGFDVALDATVSPSAIVFIASRVGFTGGTVEFSTNNGTPLSVDGDVATLTPAALMGSGCEVVATVIYQDEPHIARQSVTKLLAFDSSVPPAPTGLSARGALASINLGWDPTNDTNIGTVEIWRALTNDLAAAAPVGETAGLARTYPDNIGAAGRFYYWIRYVSKANVLGPFNAQAGTLGTTGTDAEHLLELLKDQVTESQLFGALRDRIHLVDAEGTGLVDRVDALVVTYGETDSAAQSAVLATQAKTDAIQAKVQAEGASQSAVDAKVAALQAQATAEDQASVSEQSRLAAESAKQAAETAAAASVEAKRDAESAATNAGAAATASSEERLAAQAAAGLAGTRASAANTSAGQAAGYADSAGSSAYAANQSRIAAEAAANGAVGEAGGSAGAASESARQAAASATAAGGAATAAEQSRVAADAANSQAGTKAGAAATSATQASSFADAAGASAGASQQSRLASESARDGASGSASAAATSRSDASTSANNAANSAASASTSANTASTKAGEATAAATRAATSESNAAGSASSASTSATNAANSANAVGGSAQAAAGSASTAATQATNAGNSATAANTARVAAESARDTAAGSANAASTSASTASTAAGDAGWYANSASQSASTANTAAGSALTYRNSAAQSAIDAQGHATAAAQDVTAVNARLNSVGGSGVSVEQKLTAQADSINGLRGQAVLVIDNNGYVVGWGLASEIIDGKPTSSFIVNAANFAFVTPGAAPQVMFSGGVVNGQTVVGFSGTLIGPSGSLNKLRVLDTLYGGDYTGWSWPDNPAHGGFAISPAGALFGNYFSGKYIQIYPNGDIVAPGFSIISGVPRFSGEFNDFNATASGALGGSYPNGSSTYGTVTVSVSGGRAPYQYIWSLAIRYKTSNTSRININGGADVSATISGTGTNCETTATLTCVVIDANQRAKVLTFNINASHGTPP